MLDRLGWRRRRRSDRAGLVSLVAEDPVPALIREGELVRLREHVPANKGAFQRWYADPEIAYLLRHDLEPLSPAQSSSYFDTLILPLSDRRLCFAIHEVVTDRLIGTTALTDISKRTTGRRSALFRIVIGEKDAWNHGYGTEATRLVMAEAFEYHDLTEVRLEVFRHNPRAIAAYERVGFETVGEHVEWVGHLNRDLHVIEMRLRRPDVIPNATVVVPTDMAAPESDHDLIGDSGETPTERAERIARRRALQRRRRTRRTGNSDSGNDPEPDSTE